MPAISMPAKRGGSFSIRGLASAAAAFLLCAIAALALAQDGPRSEGTRSEGTRSEGAHSEGTRGENRRGDGARGDGPRGNGRGGRDFRSTTDRPPRDPLSRGFDSPRGFDQSSRAFDGPLEATAKGGFLFIDGEYLPPPYEIRYTDDAVTVNDRQLTCIPPLPEFYGYGRGFGGPPRPEQSLRSLVGRLQRELGTNAVILSFADQPFVQFDTTTTTDLLRSMILSDGQRDVRRTEVRQRLPDSFDKDVWDNWIENYEPPAELTRRASLLLATYDEKQREAEAQIRARRWLEALIYPLEVSGMVLSVVALGHLLGGRPHAGQRTRGLDPSPALIHALNWSLFFAAAFSLLDLAWTIVTVNTNDTRELNPIGSQLIHDPLRLAQFKVGITFACLALIWVLRKQKRAQIAAWWICLVLTLVTCRWLMVNALLHSAV
jgi:hypothetical protein